ncbi:hypothetical protein CM19_11935 [Candidatus Acidianus copahuensis]|uniref:EamA domain-containing protein n=1 Tax=Candidatus Acidianus copahuensis TaxID=1160895 RepID=A0A031LJW5_9CREN|nr:DMT family transporter [Candidatus Acidianus copahuensis]EZQ01780.1 hypothetical protein CM19_11935 [Candidatus Acidianus copahuensis]
MNKILYFLIPYITLSTFNYEFAKEAVTYSTPFVFNLIRYITSAIIFLVLGGKLILSKDILFLSAMTTTSSVLWAYGLLYVSPAESAVLSYSMPLFAIPIALLIVKENPSPYELLGLGIGFSGILIYSIPLMKGSIGLGALITVVNAIFWAGFTVYYRKLKDKDPYDINASQFILGSLLLLPFAPIGFGIKLNTFFIDGIAYTSIIGGALSFFLWNMLAKLERVAKLTVMTFSVPIFSTIIQSIETYDLPQLSQVLGISVMFTGILISRLGKGIKKKFQAKRNKILLQEK